MKTVSKWLLAGSLLAVAFACQSKKQEEECDQNKKSSNGRCCSKQSKVEKPASKPVVESQKSRAMPAQASQKSVQAIRVVEQNAVAPAKEKPAPSPISAESAQKSAPSPVSSAAPAVVQAPEVKAETSLKSSAPVKSVGDVTENQSPASSLNK